MVRVQNSEFGDDGGCNSTEFRIPNADHSFLLHASHLAEAGLGRTWPNPTVGCVIVKDDTIIGQARTADGGRPHAETEALKLAGDKARGATAYVTLEPCAHHGKTPPCAEALIKAGITRIVIGAEDPDPRVSGKGIAMLQAAGIEVTRMTNHESRITNRGFFRRITHGLPYVAMKLATSADFFMARSDGGGQWITSETARDHGNTLRSQFDCLLTGIGTVLADDPILTARAPDNPHPQLVRAVADRQLRLPLHTKLVKSANTHPTWLITTPEAVEKNASHATELREAGVKFLVVEPEYSAHHASKGMDVLNAPPLSPESILRALATEGITRALIEAGPTLSAAFLAGNHVESLHWYHTHTMLGNAGACAINALEPHLANAKHRETHPLGTDSYERIELTECSPD